MVHVCTKGSGMGLDKPNKRGFSFRKFILWMFYYSYIWCRFGRIIQIRSKVWENLVRSRSVESMHKWSERWDSSCSYPPPSWWKPLFFFPIVPLTSLFSPFWTSKSDKGGFCECLHTCSCAPAKLAELKLVTEWWTEEHTNSFVDDGSPFFPVTV